ncbi:predicted protein [Uncinocarpus reesii 1704]|uniref:Uncharacterized protein n=1 Tax=Uncinocarpus reesii (strain UAMH 1704) TaxID=336963 RepID=C4JK21_UNCRE|nr:uncharacterized protein UREG_01978 [Uncinocarpus reesii 1704]EEP77129.1 predicted protein [Uncinocarpus reesii 1704]
MTNFFHQIYLGHANRVVTDYITKGRRHKISRAQIEMQILEEIEKSALPAPHRIAWYALILQTNTFEIYWLGQRDQHHLSKESIARLKPDMTLVNECAFESPESSPACSDSEMSDTPQLESTFSGVPRYLVRDDASSDDDSSDTSTSSPSPTTISEMHEQTNLIHETGSPTDEVEDEVGHPQVSGKTIPETGTVPGIARKTTPKPAQARKGRKPASGSSKPKATRMKATPRKKRQVAMKQPRVNPIVPVEDAEEDFEPRGAESNTSIEPDLQAVDEAANADEITLSKNKERGKKAWETRKRKAAEKAVAAAVALAEEQGTAAQGASLQATEGTPKGRGRKKKAVRFNDPKNNTDDEQ